MKNIRVYRQQISIIAILTVLICSIFSPVSPLTTEAEETGTTVTTKAEFMAALEQGKSPIIVDGIISIGDEATGSGKMSPVVFPAGTVIKGTTGSSISSRAPIQLAGDGVCFQDIELTFSSSTALNSVAHREIFLAGYSLTLDNVSTYLEGTGGSFGGLGGSETELLPTVYAGAFEGTETLGSNASLTVLNANSDTQFQGIYMGHEVGDDSKVPYSGNATVQLDCPFVVTEGIHTEMNNSSNIRVVGDGSAVEPSFYGNANTILTVENCTLTNTTIDGIGQIILDEKAWVQSASTELNHVTVKNGACLDFDALTTAINIASFTGISETSQTETKGILSLNKEGSLTISGEVNGICIFQTGGPSVPGMVYAEQAYIIAPEPDTDEVNFVFPQTTIDNGFELRYEEGAWTAFIREITVGKAEIVKAPSTVNVESIVQENNEEVPNSDMYFEVIWYDENNDAYSNGDAELNGFYELDYYVVGIKTEYWENQETDMDDRTDWRNQVFLMSPYDESGKYYLYVPAWEEAQTGNYTFLFLSEPYYVEEWTTVADIKSLKNKVLAEQRIVFYNSETGVPEVTPSPTPVVTPSPTPVATPTAEPTSTPVATPTAEPTSTPVVTPSPVPEATLSPTPVATPTAEPTQTPVATPTPTTEPTQKPVATPSPTPVVTPTAEPTSTPVVTPNPTPVVTSSPEPTQTPVVTPSAEPTQLPVVTPTAEPTQEPEVITSPTPVVTPSAEPTQLPIVTPTAEPTQEPEVITSPTPVVTPSPTPEVTPSQIIAPTIQPSVPLIKGTNIVKIKATKKGFQVKWKKQKKGIIGYEIQYSTKKNFKGSSTKVKLVKKKYTKTNINVKKWKKGKKYYVRIRTYTRFGNLKIYSKWSKQKMVRLRR